MLSPETWEPLSLCSLGLSLEQTSSYLDYVTMTERSCRYVGLIMLLSYMAVPETSLPLCCLISAHPSFWSRRVPPVASLGVSSIEWITYRTNCTYRIGSYLLPRGRITFPLSPLTEETVFSLGGSAGKLLCFAWQWKPISHCEKAPCPNFSEWNSLKTKVQFPRVL